MSVLEKVSDAADGFIERLKATAARGNDIGHRPGSGFKGTDPQGDERRREETVMLAARASAALEQAWHQAVVNTRAVVLMGERFAATGGRVNPEAMKVVKAGLEALPSLFPPDEGPAARRQEPSRKVGRQFVAGGPVPGHDED